MADGEKAKEIIALRLYLSKYNHGVIEIASELIKLVAAAWDYFDGSDDTSMTGDKIDRMENCSWKPPIFRFEIERHGATVNGSSRAHVYTWELDLESGRAKYSQVKQRVVWPIASPLRTKPLAEKCANLILHGVDDPTLKWYEEKRKVHVKISEYVPDDGPIQTITNRRKRFRKDLAEILKQHGWEEIPNKYNQYQKQ